MSEQQTAETLSIRLHRFFFTETRSFTSTCPPAVFRKHIIKQLQSYFGAFAAIKDDDLGHSEAISPQRLDYSVKILPQACSIQTPDEPVVTFPYQVFFSWEEV
ncbi:hypothetical protein BV898_10939 [Hypsibius exemplaris]|uniref:Uncharacterized protein n=1 Tax=Hypsibius exemplaris TaxID=2072580 RepID=A0A1W0WI71_HYPEX|nr:hypothetical protein BV898_10939 [Hypsibius exemplaris]